MAFFLHNSPPYIASYIVAYSVIILKSTVYIKLKLDFHGDSANNYN